MWNDSSNGLICSLATAEVVSDTKYVPRALAKKGRHQKIRIFLEKSTKFLVFHKSVKVFAQGKYQKAVELMYTFL